MTLKSYTMKNFSYVTKTFFVFLLFSICSFFFVSTKLPIYADGSSIIEPPVLEDVSINNDSVLLDTSKIVKVNGGDAIRVSGSGKPGDTTIITFHASEYKATIPANGKWFVLFSAPTDIKSGQYKVEGQIINKESKKSEKPTLLTIDLVSLRDANNAKSNGFLNFFHNLFSKTNIYFLIIWVLIFIIELIRLIMYIKRDRKVAR